MVWVILGLEAVWLRSGSKHLLRFLLHNLQDIPCIRQAGLSWNLKEHPAVEEIEGLVESPSRSCELESKSPWKRNAKVLRPLIRHFLEGSRVFLVESGEEPMFFLLEPWILPRVSQSAGDWNLVGKAACPIGRIGGEGEGDSLGVFEFHEKAEALGEKLADKGIGFSFQAEAEWKLALGVIGWEGGNVHCGLAFVWFWMEVGEVWLRSAEGLTPGELKHGANSKVMLVPDDEGVHTPAGVHRDCFHPLADAGWPLFKRS